jgi:predicted  nucleic acid-binding Zn-ribbon protein
MAQTHICSRCKAEFATEQEYLNHVCPETGFKPTEQDHQGDEFKAVSEAAIARGAAKKASKK